MSGGTLSWSAEDFIGGYLEDSPGGLAFGGVYVCIVWVIVFRDVSCGVWRGDVRMNLEVFGNVFQLCFAISHGLCGHCVRALFSCWLEHCVCLVEHDGVLPGGVGVLSGICLVFDCG